MRVLYSSKACVVRVRGMWNCAAIVMLEQNYCTEQSLCIANEYNLGYFEERICGPF